MASGHTKLTEKTQSEIKEIYLENRAGCTVVEKLPLQRVNNQSSGVSVYQLNSTAVKKIEKIGSNSILV